MDMNCNIMNPLMHCYPTKIKVNMEIMDLIKSNYIFSEFRPIFSLSPQQLASPGNGRIETIDLDIMTSQVGIQLFLLPFDYDLPQIASN